MGCKQTVIASGHKLCYEWVNKQFHKPEKPVLLFLHEGLGCIGKWKEFPQSLSTVTELPGLIYERYGYGNSDPLSGARQPNFLHKEAFETLPELLNNLNIGNPLILIGHSDGGSISLLFSSMHPDQVKMIILEAPHVLIEEQSVEGLKSAIWAYKHSDLKERLEKYHGNNTDSMFWGWANVWSDEKSLDWNIESYLSGIKVPVLFIQGENDEYGTLKQLESIKKGVKGNVTTEIIKDCGHIPHHQSEEVVLDKMKQFILRNL